MSERRTRDRLIAGVLFAGLLTPGAASAHLISTGFGPLYDGLAHPFLSPGDLLPVLALAAWGGLLGPLHARWVVLLLPVAWLLGGLAGLAMPASRMLMGAELVGAVLLGVAAAANLGASRSLLLAVAGVLGLLHGLGATAGEEGSLIAVFGSAVTVAACYALVAGQVASLRMDWMRIATRALCSWTAAIGLLQLGWMWKG